EQFKVAELTAIYLALPSDTAVLRAALVIRQARERYELFDAPVFYRWRADESSEPLLGDYEQEPIPGNCIPLEAPSSILMKELTDADGREVLARALHEAYLQGS